jgi:hypothetical protein
MQREFTTVAVRHSPVLYFHPTSVDRTKIYTGALSATLPSFATSKMPNGSSHLRQERKGLVKAVYPHMFILSGGADFPTELDMKRPVTKATIPPAVQEL